MNSLCALSKITTDWPLRKVNTQTTAIMSCNLIPNVSDSSDAVSTARNILAQIADACPSNSLLQPKIQRAIGLEECDTKVMFDTALLLRSIGETERALYLFQEYFSLYPNSTVAKLHLGIQERLCGLETESRAHLEEIKNVDPNNVQVLLNLFLLSVLAPNIHDKRDELLDELLGIAQHLPINMNTFSYISDGVVRLSEAYSGSQNLLDRIQTHLDKMTGPEGNGSAAPSYLDRPLIDREDTDNIIEVFIDCLNTPEMKNIATGALMEAFPSTTAASNTFPMAANKDLVKLSILSAETEIVGLDGLVSRPDAQKFLFVNRSVPSYFLLAILLAKASERLRARLAQSQNAILFEIGIHSTKLKTSLINSLKKPSFPWWRRWIGCLTGNKNPDIILFSRYIEIAAKYSGNVHYYPQRLYDLPHGASVVVCADPLKQRSVSDQSAQRILIPHGQLWYIDKIDWTRIKQTPETRSQIVGICCQTFFGQCDWAFIPNHMEYIDSFSKKSSESLFSPATNDGSTVRTGCINIICTGYISLDLILEKKLDQFPYDKTILFAPTASTHNQSEYKKYVKIIQRIVANLLAGFPDYNIVFRQHPQSTGYEFLKEVFADNARFSFSSAPDYYDEYKKAAILISDGSSTLMSFALGTLKPVVTLDMLAQGRHRTIFGEIIGGAEFAAQAVTDSLERRNEIHDDLAAFREQNIAHVQQALDKTAQAVFELARGKKPKDRLSVTYRKTLGDA